MRIIQILMVVSVLFWPALIAQDQTPPQGDPPAQEQAAPADAPTQEPPPAEGETAPPAEAEAAEPAEQPPAQAPPPADAAPEAPTEAEAPAEAEASVDEAPADEAAAEQIDPQAPAPLSRENFVAYFDPDIALGSIIAENVEVKQLLREISLVKKVNLAVSDAISAKVDLNLGTVNPGLNELLNLLTHHNPIVCERIGGFVYVKERNASATEINNILYDQKEEMVAFELSSMRLDRFANNLIEITGKNVLFRSDIVKADSILRGYQAMLPFEEGLAALMQANGFGLRKEGNIFRIERVQGVRLETDGDIAVWFELAPLQMVMQKIVEVLDGPIMIRDELEGLVSIDVENIKNVETLLDLLLNNTQFSYTFEDDVYLVGRSDSPLLFYTEMVNFEKVHAETVLGMLPEALKEGATVHSVKELNSLLITGDRSRVKELASIARAMDQRVPQVLIEVVMVQFNLSDTLDVGLGLTTGDGQELFPNLDATFQGFRDESGSYNIIKLPSDFSVRLKALADQGKAKVITKPQVATLSGNEANLTIGTTLYYRLNSEELVGDENPRVRTTETISSVEANTSLTITPWVMNNDLVTVKIQTAFNTFAGAVVDNVPPAKNTNTITSLVRLRNGQTVVLGGLNIDEQSVSQRGLPWLMKIPLFGALFRDHAKSTTLNEMILYITPRIYTGEKSSPEFITDPSVLDYRLPSRLRKSKKKDKKKRRGLFRGRNRSAENYYYGGTPRAAEAQPPQADTPQTDTPPAQQPPAESTQSSPAQQPPAESTQSSPPRTPEPAETSPDQTENRQMQ